MRPDCGSKSDARSGANGSVLIELLPMGKTLTVARGTLLQDVLFSEGVEFACGGHGRCRKCAIKVVDGPLGVAPADERAFGPSEISEGWRLACQARAESDLRIELAQWEAAILGDQRAFAFTPQEGLGIAVDVGTTTVVAQLLDLRTGNVLGVASALNDQARHGGDIMSRVDYAVWGRHGVLTDLVRSQIGRMLKELLDSRPVLEPVKEVVLVGNTVMHHLFCGIDLKPLSHHPFEPEYYGLQVMRCEDLGWKIPGAPLIRFLPCLGGFVGSDILAGILGTRLLESEALVALVDLGTNGEIVVGNRERLLCASTAAGPAFEGARISMGMRAVTGAIAEVSVDSGQLSCRVLGNARPRGICGSGLVDAVAAGLDLRSILPTGRLAKPEPILIAPPVKITQADVRELQLAKGAIAAGLRLLIEQWGADLEEIQTIYLAGAFGNYINRASAQRIGLIDFPPEKVQPAGNTALLGAKLALFALNRTDGSYPEVLRRIEHVSLNLDPQFQDVYIDQMRFPE